MEATMTMQKPYRLDALGFPAVTCPRCDGRGNLPQYSKIFQGVCFECDGSRLVYPTKTIATAAKTCRNRLAATSTPSPELLAEIADAAAKTRDSYDKTLARREARTGSRLPADARSLVDAIRAALNSNDLDNIEKAVEIRRIRYRRVNTPAARRVRDDLENIQMGRDEHAGTDLPQRLALIAAYLDNLTGSKQ